MREGGVGSSWSLHAAAARPLRLAVLVQCRRVTSRPRHVGSAGAARRRGWTQKPSEAEDPPEEVGGARDTQDHVLQL